MKQPPLQLLRIFKTHGDARVFLNLPLSSTVLSHQLLLSSFIRVRLHHYIQLPTHQTPHSRYPPRYFRLQLHLHRSEPRVSSGGFKKNTSISMGFKNSKELERFIHPPLKAKLSKYVFGITNSHRSNDITVVSRCVWWSWFLEP